jgi:hypothetical protein
VIGNKGCDGIVRMSEEQWNEETERLAYGALEPVDYCKLSKLMNISLKRSVMAKIGKSPFVKDKSKNMLVMTNSTSLIEISHHSTVQAIFDCYFNFVQCVPFGVSCIYKEKGIVCFIKF